jgi:hypothetical protein
MKLFFTVIYAYITYSTFKFAFDVWKKENKKFASVFIGILGTAVPVLGYIVFWM